MGDPGMMAGGIFTIVIILVSVVFGLAVTGGTLWFVYTKVLGPMMKSQQQQQQLLTSGQRAQGRILQLAQTGTYVNNQPQVQIVLEVAPPGGVPYQAQFVTILSMLAIPRVQPGAIVAVRYNPANPSEVMIEGL